MHRSLIRFDVAMLAGLLVMVLAGSVHADIPEIISYQGKVTDTSGVPVADGTYYWLAFNLQDRNGVRYQSDYESGSHYWVSSYYGQLPAQFDISRARADTIAFVLRAVVSVIQGTG